MRDVKVPPRFFFEHNKKHKKAIKGIHRKAMGCLEVHPFTGNIRELENEIERAIAMAEVGEPIQVSHLSEKIRKNLEADHPPVSVKGALKQTVETLEKSALLEMLEKHQGNRSRAAKALGLSRYGLTKKIQRYGI